MCIHDIFQIIKNNQRCNNLVNVGVDFILNVPCMHSPAVLEELETRLFSILFEKSQSTLSKSTTKLADRKQIKVAPAVTHKV
jgi:hypothetical protein